MMSDINQRYHQGVKDNCKGKCNSFMNDVNGRSLINQSTIKCTINETSDLQVARSKVITAE